LLPSLRRLKARGEIRGGGCVAGFSDERFALPHAIGLLREARRKPATGEFVSIAGAEPLNLAGILTPGPRLAALTGNRLLYRDGLPIAFLAGGEVQSWRRWMRRRNGRRARRCCGGRWGRRSSRSEVDGQRALLNRFRRIGRPAAPKSSIWNDRPPSTMPGGRRA